jgi:predicted kinase
MGPRTAPPIIVALEGISGVGKTEAARTLADSIPNAVLLREAHARIRPPLNLSVPDRPSLQRVEGRLVREELERWREARSALAAGRSVVADTGFLGPLTYSVGLAAVDPRRDLAERLRKAYSATVRNRTLGAVDLTVWLELPASARRARAGRDPAGHPPHLLDRHDRIGRLEERIWKRTFAPVLGARFRAVSARGPSGVVARRILALTHRPPPLAPRERTELLATQLEAERDARATLKKRTRRGPNPRP